MSNGDQDNIFLRLKNYLVPWFGQSSPNADALLKGIAKTDNTIFNQLVEVNNDARIKTATGQALDLISIGYFGYSLPRRIDESDASFRSRILANLIQERATLNGMITVLKNLTGRNPAVIEGFNSLMVGSYDQNFYYDTSYHGGYGFLNPYTAIIYAYRPITQGFLGVGGYDQATLGDAGFGYDFYFNNSYVDLSQEVIFVTDQDIINAIQATKMLGTYMYVSIFD